MATLGEDREYGQGHYRAVMTTDPRRPGLLVQIGWVALKTGRKTWVPIAADGYVLDGRRTPELAADYLAGNSRSRGPIEAAQQSYDERRAQDHEAFWAKKTRQRWIVNSVLLVPKLLGVYYLLVVATPGSGWLLNVALGMFILFAWWSGGPFEFRFDNYPGTTLNSRAVFDFLDGGRAKKKQPRGSGDELESET
jgi:hypothetical protein